MSDNGADARIAGGAAQAASGAGASGGAADLVQRARLAGLPVVEGAASCA